MGGEYYGKYKICNKESKTNSSKNLQNRMKKSELRTTIRNYDEAINANSPECEKCSNLL